MINSSDVLLKVFVFGSHDPLPVTLPISEIFLAIAKSLTNDLSTNLSTRSLKKIIELVLWEEKELILINNNIVFKLLVFGSYNPFPATLPLSYTLFAVVNNYFVAFLPISFTSSNLILIK